MSEAASRRVLIVAGESSGDAQAARLVREMFRRDPTLEVVGAGGGQMRSAGVRTIVDIEELSIMGISEVASGLGRVWKSYRRIVKLLRSRPPPGLLILVDFPDFNLRLARLGHKAGVKVLYYVSPQLWAWRAGRVRAICRHVNRMIVVFPFEVELYRSRGLDVRFLGHPLAEEVQATRTTEQTRALLGVAPGRSLVALLPGSRRSEVRRLLPLMLAAAEIVGERAYFAIAKAPGLEDVFYQGFLKATGRNVALVSDQTYNLLAASDAAAVTSGTATVECALLGCPMVVVYRMSRLSYTIARVLVRAPHIAMPNILLGASVVPELLQGRARPDSLANALLEYLDSPERAARVTGRLAEIRQSLVIPGAARRAAHLALEMLA